MSPSNVSACKIGRNAVAFWISINLAYLSWAKARSSSGSDGSLLKSYDGVEAQKVYCSLSGYRAGDGAVGHECANEIAAGRLLEILGIPHLGCRLIHANVMVNGGVHERWLNAFDDLRPPVESKAALDTYCELERVGDGGPLEFCQRMDWSDNVWIMLVVDYLILNRHRMARTPKCYATLACVRGRTHEAGFPRGIVVDWTEKK